MQASKILYLNQAVNTINDAKFKSLMSELRELHSPYYRVFSPAFAPYGGSLEQEITLYRNMHKCLSSSSTARGDSTATTGKDARALTEIDVFYFDKELNGVAITWRLTGIHSSICPAPYDYKKPTHRRVELKGTSWLRFDPDGRVLVKQVLFDNNYLKKTLAGNDITGQIRGQDRL